MRHAIIRLKYEGRKQLAEPLGMYLADFIQNRPFAVDGFDLIVPIPLHRKRLFDREFNQAALLAEQIHRATGTPMNLDCVKRERITRPQVGLTAAERTANVRGAFRVLDDYAVRGKTILLIDDVATTLSTANSCAGELLDSGAHAVHLATLARDL